MIVLKATQEKVLAVLQSVAGIVERRHTLPILANVLIRKTGNAVQVTTSDLEIQIRTTAEMDILARHGDQSVIFELQGSLFFGTTDQLYTALEPELGARRFVVLDLRRVQSVDVTAVHMLQQVEDRLAERGAMLMFSAIPARVPSGRDIQRYFREVGLAHADSRARVFGEIDDALAWIEDRVIAEARIQQADESALELREMELFSGRKSETLAVLVACMDTRICKAGER